MNKSDGFNKLILLITLMFITYNGWSAKAFVKLTTGYSLSQTATWTDQNSKEQTEVMVYGLNYFSEGKTGNSIMCGISLGISISGWMDLAIDLNHSPDTKFYGQVNYPNAGTDQPVTALIKTTTFTIRSQIYPLGRSTNRRTMNPFIGFYAGLASHHTDSVKMAFPQLAHPHTFITPEGQNTTPTYGFAIGNSINLHHDLTIDISFSYLFLGIATTDSGNAQIRRDGKISKIRVGSTESSLKETGIRIGVKYTFDLF